MGWTYKHQKNAPFAAPRSHPRHPWHIFLLSTQECRAAPLQNEIARKTISLQDKNGTKDSKHATNEGGKRQTLSKYLVEKLCVCQVCL